MTEKRWGVWYAGPTEYASLVEARRQLMLAQADVPARLIFNDGDGWRDYEGGHRMGKLGLADDIKLLDEFAKTAPEEIDGALVSVTRKLEEVEHLLEQRKRVMADFKDREKRYFDAGNAEMASKYAVQHRATRREVGRLERILYDA